MACSAKFDSDVPFECIVEIFNDVRGGKIDPRAIAVKAAWVLGCSIQATGYTSGESFMAEAMDECQMVDELEQYFGTASGEVYTAGAIPPEIWMLLFKLLRSLI